MYLLYMLSFLIIFDFIKTDDINYVKQLRNKFLRCSNYDRFTRPVLQSNKTVKIKFGLVITQILELDLKREILTTDAILTVKWLDEYIKWDPKKYGSVTKIRFNFDEIWRPEIEIWNGGFDLSESEKYASYSEMVAFSNGTVYWITPMTLMSQCALILKDYPFDNQECDIILGIKNYLGKEVAFIQQLSNKNEKGSVIGPWAPNNEYKVADLSSEIKMESFDQSLPFSTVQIKIKLQRRLSNYFIYLALPHLFSIIFCLFMFNFQFYSGVRDLFAILSILLDLKVIYIISSQIALRSYDTPDLIKSVVLNLVMIGFLFIISILIRQNVTFLCSKVECFKNVENLFITKLFLIRSSKLIEDDLIKMIKNDQYTKIVQIDRLTLNRFSILIQLIERFLILIYCLFILNNLKFIILMKY